MSDHESHSEIKIGSERNFGLTFAAVFLVLAVMGYVQWKRSLAERSPA